MRPASAQRWSGVVGSAGTMVLAGLVPKCPLCVAALLAAVGVGSATATVLAPAVKPLLIACAAILLAAVAMRDRRGRTRPCAACGTSAAHGRPLEDAGGIRGRW